MSENITEKEALQSIADPKDNLIDALFEKVARLQLQLIDTWGRKSAEPSNPVGIRVTDMRGDSYEYPTADRYEVTDDRVLRVLSGEDRILAEFSRWDRWERMS